ncbi:hypothetical protein [Ensifer sp. Root142]|uniref:hypothetical protein n=1 Tax=Ensifer sp. Root142 TaxID=1736461 RepID=UPI000A4F1FA1|nr:hypothetical protein [Ensifer sp. Root142]
MSASDLQPFRVHFHDPDLAPIDIDALCAADAREIAIERRGVSPGAIRKTKLIRETS